MHFNKKYINSVDNIFRECKNTKFYSIINLSIWLFLIQIYRKYVLMLDIG